jgi:hypothetical protein
MLARVRTPSSSVREREREIERERGRQREREIGREGEREMYNMVIYIFKRNNGSLGTF